MQLRVALVVALAVLQLGSAQECGVVVVAEDKLRKDVNQTIHTALEAERKIYKEEIREFVLATMKTEKEQYKEDINKTIHTALEAERERYKETNTTVHTVLEEISKAVDISLEADREKCKQEINKAVQWAVENITDTVQQLLNPLLTDLAKHHLPGTTSHHPATSCEEVKNSNPNCLSGYYWIQTATHPLVQQRCDFDRVGLSQDNPATSCKEVKEKCPKISSGYYWVENSEEQVIQVYCDMERTCGNVTGGWMRVADIDMRNSSHTCPSGLNTLLESSKRLCSMNITGVGCSSATITTHGVQYSYVCGKIIGYQQKTPNAFAPYYFDSTLTIDDVYVDGISLTYMYGGSRKHIWTFAAALHEVITSHQQALCPCTNINNPTTINIPPYVGDDYFCETGSSNFREFIFYPDDPLWDGEGCGPVSTCCSFNNPPWFSKQLPLPTTDDIEMRLCASGPRSNEDITFEQVELYVQ